MGECLARDASGEFVLDEATTCLCRHVRGNHDQDPVRVAGALVDQPLGLALPLGDLVHLGYDPCCGSRDTGYQSATVDRGHRQDVHLGVVHERSF
jgi:hypothetical protein